MHINSIYAQDDFILNDSMVLPRRKLSFLEFNDSSINPI